MMARLEFSYRLIRLAWAVYKTKGWLALVWPILPIGAGYQMGDWLFDSSLGPIVAVPAFVILGFLIFGWVFQKRHIEFDSDRFERLFFGARLVPLGEAAKTITLRNREFSEDEVRHDLLKGIWRGDFEDEFGQSHLFLPHAPGIVLWNGEWMPSDGHGRVIGYPELVKFRRKDLLAAWGSSLKNLRPSPGELRDLSEYEVNQLVDFEAIESLRPAQYDGTDLSVYFDPIVVPNWMFVRWFVKWKKGDYGTHEPQEIAQPVPPKKLQAGANVRMPMIDLMTKAQNSGWQILDPNSQINEFAAAIKQAGHDSVLVFSGRPVKHHSSNETIRHETIRPIPADHWDEYRFDWDSAIRKHPLTGAIEGINTDNFPALSSKWNHEKGYVDLHVDRQGAIAWLGGCQVRINHLIGSRD